MAVFATMLRHHRERNGLRIVRASWLVGMSAARVPRARGRHDVLEWDTYARIRDLFGWPR